MHHKSLVASGILLIAVVAVIVIVVNFDLSSDEDRPDDWSDEQAIQNIIAEKERDVYEYENVYVPWIEEFGVTTNQDWDGLRDSAYRFRDEGRVLDITEIYLDSWEHRFSTVYANSFVLNGSKFSNLYYNDIVTPDGTVVVTEGNKYILCSSFDSDDFTLMYWYGGPIYASEDSIIRSPDGEVLLINEGYNFVPYFQHFEPWIFSPGVFYAGYVMSGPNDSDHMTSPVFPCLLFGDEPHAIVKDSLRMVDETTGRFYDSLQVAMRWNYGDYSGFVGADLELMLDAYGTFIEKVQNELNACFDLIVQYYSQDPSNRFDLR